MGQGHRTWCLKEEVETHEVAGQKVFEKPLWGHIWYLNIWSEERGHTCDPNGDAGQEGDEGEGEGCEGGGQHHQVRV